MKISRRIVLYNKTVQQKSIDHNKNDQEEKAVFVRHETISPFGNSAFNNHQFKINLANERDAIRPWWSNYLLTKCVKHEGLGSNHSIAELRLLDMLKSIAEEKTYLTINLLDEED